MTDDKSLNIDQAKTMLQKFTDHKYVMKQKRNISGKELLLLSHAAGEFPYDEKMELIEYETEKHLLQTELLKVQSWVKETGQRIVQGEVLQLGFMCLGGGDVTQDRHGPILATERDLAQRQFDRAGRLIRAAHEAFKPSVRIITWRCMDRRTKAPEVRQEHVHMQPDQFILRAAKQPAGGFVCGPDHAMLIEGHDPVEALFDDAGHHPIELLELQALIESKVDIVFGTPAGQHGRIILQQRPAGQPFVKSLDHGSTDTIRCSAIAPSYWFIKMTKALTEA